MLQLLRLHFVALSEMVINDFSGILAYFFAFYVTSAAAMPLPSSFSFVCFGNSWLHV